MNGSLAILHPLMDQQEKGRFANFVTIQSIGHHVICTALTPTPQSEVDSAIEKFITIYGFCVKGRQTRGWDAAIHLVNLKVIITIADRISFGCAKGA